MPYRAANSTACKSSQRRRTSNSAPWTRMPWQNASAHSRACWPRSESPNSYVLSNPRPSQRYPHPHNDLWPHRKCLHPANSLSRCDDHILKTPSYRIPPSTTFPSLSSLHDSRRFTITPLRAPSMAGSPLIPRWIHTWRCHLSALCSFASVN